MDANKVNTSIDLLIEKFEFLGVEHEQHASFQLDRYVVQNITDMCAGFIWTFLQSLPPNWEVNKYHLMRHFDIGEQKLKKHMAFLKKSDLIDYLLIRDKSGTIQGVKIKVLNGSKFVSIREVPFGAKPSLKAMPTPVAQKLSTRESEAQSVVVSTGMKNHPVDKPPGGKSSTYSINTSNSTNTNNTTTTDPLHITNLITNIDIGKGSSSSSCEGKRKMIEEVDLNPLRSLYFPTPALEELQRLYSPRPEVLEESIIHLTFDVDVNKKADHIDLDIVNFFMKIMRKGNGYGAPRGYKKRGMSKETSKKPKPEDEILKRKIQKLEAFTSKYRKQWQDTQLTDDLKHEIWNKPDNVVKIQNQPHVGMEGFKTALCRTYFNNEILPELIAQQDDGDLLDAWLMKCKSNIST